jgi:peptidoglycan/LPS O-acetylase OafA/YrhL
MPCNYRFKAYFKSSAFKRPFIAATVAWSLFGLCFHLNLLKPFTDWTFVKIYFNFNVITYLLMFLFLYLLNNLLNGKDRESVHDAQADLLVTYRNHLMGIAILLVLLWHLICGYLSYHPNPLYLLNQIGYLGVDIFVFLSGFGLTCGYLKRKLDLKRYYVRRILRIYLLYWFFLFIRLIENDFSFPYGNIVINILNLQYWFYGMESPTGHLNYGWFLSFLVTLYALYPGYLKLFVKTDRKFLLTLIISVFIITCQICFLDSKWGLSSFRIPSFLVGIYIGFLHLTIPDFNEVIIKKEYYWHMVSALLLVLLESIIIVYRNLFWSYNLYLITMCLTPFFIFSFVNILRRTSMKWLSFIGAMSLEIYLVHPYGFLITSLMVNTMGMGNIELPNTWALNNFVAMYPYILMVNTIFLSFLVNTLRKKFLPV